MGFKSTKFLPLSLGFPFFLGFSLFLGLPLSSSWAIEREILKLCYFSLNNEKEFEEMQALAQKLHRALPQVLEVKEQMELHGDPRKSFQKMVEEENCDGLVISGHHTISWGGRRTHTGLKLDFIEELSCEPKYEEWFSSVRAVWLQGCRTLGDTAINREENAADFHAHRVGRMLEEDHLSQSVADLNYEFSELLDQNNPVSYRYLKVFPQAQLFGWTASAPGERSRSERSVPYHLMQIMKLENNRFPMDVFQESYSQEEASYLWRSLEIALGENSLELASQGWLKHGAPGGPYAYGNEDIATFPPLYQQNNRTFLERAKFLSCTLLREEKVDPIPIVEEILGNRELIAHSFRSLNFLLDSYLGHASDREKKERVMKKLRSSKELYAFLEEKLQSNRVGFLRKINYLSLFVKIGGMEGIVKETEDLITEQSISILKNKVYLDLNPSELHYYKAGILENLIENDFNKEKLKSIVSVVRNYKIPVIKLKVIEAAGKIGGSFGEEILEAGVDSPNTFLQQQSIRRSIEVNEEFAWKMVHKGLLKPDVNVYVQMEGMKIAVQLGGEEAWKVIEKMQYSPHEIIREKSLFSSILLAFSEEEKNLAHAEKIIQDALLDTSSVVRMEAITVAGKFLERDVAFQIIDKGLSDESSEVRERAEGVIASLSCYPTSGIHLISRLNIQNSTKTKLSDSLGRKCGWR